MFTSKTRISVVFSVVFGSKNTTVDTTLLYWIPLPQSCGIEMKICRAGMLPTGPYPSAAAADFGQLPVQRLLKPT